MHIDNVKKLYQNIEEAIVEIAERKLQSGAVDTEKYEDTEYYFHKLYVK